MSQSHDGTAGTRERIELGFERWGRFVAAHPWIVMTASLLAVAALASTIPRIEFDTSSEGFLEPDDPARIAYDAFREQFGREDAIVLAIRTSEVFRFAFLDRLRALHEQIEDEAPHLDEVTSLVNARYTRGEGDRLLVDDFLEEWPETEADLARLRERALGHPLYPNVLLSEDAHIATILVRPTAFSSLGGTDDALAAFEDLDFQPPADEGAERPRMLTGEENAAFVTAVTAVVEAHRAPDFEIHMAGQPVLTDSVMRGMIGDMGRFTALSIVVIAAFLGYLFRSFAAVALALLTALLSVVCGFGVMGALQIPLSTPTQITPSFLLAVGVGNSVHLLAIFFQRRRDAVPVADAVAYSLRHSGLAIVMTGLTTAGSLASFMSAELALIADFGVVGPLGALLALTLSLVFLPAAMAVVPMRPRSLASSSLRALPVALGRVGTRSAVATTAAWGLLLALALLAVRDLRFANDPLDWFRPGEPFRVAAELINDELGGANSIELVIDTHSENGLYEPAVLERIEAVQAYAEGVPVGTGSVGRTTVSVVEVLKETHQALNGNQPGFHVLPGERQLVAQELLLFENSGTDDLEDVVDTRLQLARVSLPIPLVDSVLLTPIVERFERELPGVVGEDLDVVVTGGFKVNSAVAVATIHSMSRTYAVAFAAITPFMMVLLGSIRTGLLSMIPAMGSILVTLGLMVVLDLPLDGFTLLVGCIALGLAVDDTIHFMHNFARARAGGMDVERAVRTTLESTGQALFFTSLVLSAGFLIYTQARMNLLTNFGLLTAFAITMAFLANVTLAPALVTLLARLRGEAGVKEETG